MLGMDGGDGGAVACGRETVAVKLTLTDRFTLIVEPVGLAAAGVAIDSLLPSCDTVESQELVKKPGTMYGGDDSAALMVNVTRDVGVTEPRGDDAEDRIIS